MATLDWDNTPADQPSKTSNKSVEENLIELDRIELEMSKQYRNRQGSPKNWRDFFISSPTIANKFDSFVNITRDVKAPRVIEKPKPHITLTDDYTPFANFDWTNIICAGGYPGIVLNNQYNKTSDIDLYIWGLTEDQAIKRIQYIIKYFADYTEKILGKNSYLKIIRTEISICLFWGRFIRQIQIVMVLPRDPLELVLSFDIAPSRIFYDGKVFWMTKSATIAHFSKKYLVGELTKEIYSKSLEKRMQKYQERGFERIGPLSITLLKYENAPESVYADFDDIAVEKNTELTHEYDSKYGLVCQKNAKFMFIRYKPFMKGYDFYPGVFFSVTSLSWINFFLNNPDKYWEHLHDSIKTYNDGSNYEFKFPKPELGALKFKTVNQFIDFIISQR